MVYTQLHVVHDPPSTFPSYIYRVIDFDHVANIVGQTVSFIGKIGFPLSYNMFSMYSQCFVSLAFILLLIKKYSVSTVQMSLA
jgi:hypothetical protein